MIAVVCNRETWGLPQYHDWGAGYLYCECHAVKRAEIDRVVLLWKDLQALFFNKKFLWLQMSLVNILFKGR